MTILNIDKTRGNYIIGTEDEDTLCTEAFVGLITDQGNTNLTFTNQTKNNAS